MLIEEYALCIISADEAAVKKMRAWTAEIVTDWEKARNDENGLEKVSAPKAEKNEKAAPAEADDASSKATTETISSITSKMETVEAA